MGLIFISHLGEIVKGLGFLLYIPLDKLGLVRQVTKDEVTAVDMSVTNQEIDFEVAGQYAFYTSNLDLLLITDAILEGENKPWIRLEKLDDGQQIKVEFIERGLMVYDTPFAKGRPIFTFFIPSHGKYRMQNATQPGAVGYFVRDYISGNEQKYTIFFISEIILICLPIGWLGLHRARRKINKVIIRQNENKKRADALMKLLKKETNHSK
ncbi:MAG: hypothetical protein ACPL4H_11050 [Anaerolineales bacterium]